MAARRGVQQHDIGPVVVAEQHGHQAQPARDVDQARVVAHPRAHERGLVGDALAVGQPLLGIEHVQPVLGHDLVEGAQQHVRRGEVARTPRHGGSPGGWPGSASAARRSRLSCPPSFHSEAVEARVSAMTAVPQLPTMQPEIAWSDVKVYVAGHNGLVGSAIVPALEAAGVGEVIGWRSSELDLTRPRGHARRHPRGEARRHHRRRRARSAGSWPTRRTPSSSCKDNLLIQTNVMDAAHSADVERLLFLGSSCIYPRHATQPIRESSLMTGPARAHEPGVRHGQDLRHLLHRGAPHASTAATGSRRCRPTCTDRSDNFDLQTSHVLPAFIRRFHEAKVSGASDRHGLGHRRAAPRVPARRRPRAGLPDAAAEVRLRGDDQRRPRRRHADQGTGRDGGRRSSASRARSSGTPPSPTACRASCSTPRASTSWAGIPTIKLRDGLASTYDWYVENVA